MSDPRSDELMARFRREAHAALGDWEFDAPLREQVRRKLAAAGHPEPGSPAATRIPGGAPRWPWALAGLVGAAAVAVALIRLGKPASPFFAPSTPPRSSQAARAENGGALRKAPMATQESAVAQSAAEGPVAMEVAPAGPPAASAYSDGVHPGKGAEDASAPVAPAPAAQGGPGVLRAREEPAVPGTGTEAGSVPSRAATPADSFAPDGKGVSVKYSAVVVVPEVTIPARRPAAIDVILQAVTDLPAFTVSAEIRTPAGVASLPERSVPEGLASGAKRQLRLQWNGKLPGSPGTWVPPGDYPVSVRVHVQRDVAGAAESVVHVKAPPG